MGRLALAAPAPSKTRAHRRLRMAHFELFRVHAMAGARVRTLDSWCMANFGAPAHHLSVAQARCARRRLNAWRYSLGPKEARMQRPTTTKPETAFDRLEDAIADAAAAGVLIVVLPFVAVALGYYLGRLIGLML